MDLFIIYIRYFLCAVFENIILAQLCFIDNGSVKGVIRIELLAINW